MVTTTRRRADSLVDAIRAATRAELTERGYAGVTFEGVARRARTSKPVLYRRYRSRAHLVFDAIGPVIMVQSQGIATKSLRDDLLTLLRRVTAQLQAYGTDTIRNLIGEAD